MDTSKNILSCPWDTWQPGTTQFCEAHLCSWVESPAIAWAALAYVIAGIAGFILIRRKTKELSFNLFPWIAILMGIGSFGYHASHTYVFQFIDVLAMLAFGSLLACSSFGQLMNLQSSSLAGTKAVLPIWIMNLCLSMSVFHFLKGSAGAVLLVVWILVFVGHEIVLKLKQSNRSMTKFSISFGIFTIAVLALWIEKKSGLCDPHNHIFQWHAVWDIFSSFLYVLVPLHLIENHALIREQIQSKSQSSTDEIDISFE